MGFNFKAYMFYSMICTGLTDQYYYPFTVVYILISDYIIECILFSYELMESCNLLIQTYIPALRIDLNCLCVIA